MPEVITTGTRAPDAPRPPDAQVRYADPAAWLVCDLVGRALRDWPGDRGPLAVLGVSEYATGDTLRRVAADVGKGTVSPLRFVAASPGTLVGLSCLQFGLHGPSLLLTMPPAEGLPVARVLAARWLSGAAPAVLLVTHEVDRSGTHRGTCELLEAA
ncbi:hypothetical protein [Amycolatopsis nalaikhensis]|uniref:Uncharacterized protein n=1 Tax=Amycolatopsis nalaikhensis TaxID=715472 RepID=A0ABY8XH52_9PSEU|nr:hypothetical protein [Amycolatopsis sp. 2-2]WIV54928.1 hypothetical protein QP939_39815 [Amycolatopsis sp. 2-2]